MPDAPRIERLRAETPRGWTLKTWLLGSFFSIIALIALLILLISVTIIRREFIDRAQTQVVNDLKVARMLYHEELEIMQGAFSLLDDPGQAERIRERLKLDYVRVARPGETPAGEIAARALTTGEAVQGSRLIEAAELLSWDTTMLARIEVPIAETPKSRPRTREVVDRALAIECAQPLRDDHGRVTAVVYGGRILNRNNALVDRIRDFVFDDRVVKGAPGSTAPSSSRTGISARTNRSATSRAGSSASSTSGSSRSPSSRWRTGSFCSFSRSSSRPRPWPRSRPSSSPPRSAAP
jgi:hypothetical protein